MFLDVEMSFYYVTDFGEFYGLFKAAYVGIFV